MCGASWAGAKGTPNRPPTAIYSLRDRSSRPYTCRCPPRPSPLTDPGVGRTPGGRALRLGGEGMYGHSRLDLV